MLRRAMRIRIERWLLGLVFAVGSVLVGAASAHAERNTLGPHFGINFDVDDPFIGVEGRFDIANIGRSAIVQVNPTFSYYFTDNVDLFNFSLNFPFEFKIGDSVLRPLFAPGLGIYHLSWDNDSNTEVTLNLLGGLLFFLPPVEPFVQLKVAIGDDSMAELLGGILFQL